MRLESQLRYSDHDARVNGLRRTAGIQIFVLRNATIAHRIGYIAATAIDTTGISHAVLLLPTATLPTITGFTPVSGKVGTTVTISGDNLTNVTAVKFNGYVAPTYAVPNGYVCQPGTLFVGEDGRRHLCQ